MYFIAILLIFIFEIKGIMSNDIKDGFVMRLLYFK